MKAIYIFYLLSYTAIGYSQNSQNERFTRILSNIEDLRNYKGPFQDGQTVSVNGYYKKADGGGGMYTWDASATAADDGGGIIKPNNANGPGRFIHEVTNGIVNLKWWGIKPYIKYTAEYDIADDIDKAVSFMSRNPQWNTLYIPADTGGISGAYYISRTIIARDLNLKGDGFIGKPLTRLNFPARTTGIRVPAINRSRNGNSVSVENLEIFQAYDYDKWGDTTAHGMEIRSKVSVKNVSVTYAAGNGFHIVACASDTLSRNYGNANLSTFENCAASFTNHGMYLSGCDANKITIIKFDATTVRRWGIYDNGFLGNTYISPHFAFSGTASGSNVVVKHNGRFYIAITPDDSININRRPDLFPAHWEPATPMAATEWDPKKRYWSGGPFLISDPNAQSTILDPYFEESQPPARLNTRSLSINGTRGVEIKGGVDLRAMFGVFYINSDMSLPRLSQKLGIGTEMPQAPLHIVSNNAITGNPYLTILESSTNYVWLRYKTAAGDSYFNVNGTDINLFPGNKNSLAATTTGVYPGVSDNTYNLGEKSRRWKEMYSTNAITNNLQIISPRTLSAAVKTLVIDTITKEVGWQTQMTASGTYRPSLSDAVNIDGTTWYDAQWMRVGNMVTVSGKVSIKAKAAAAKSSFKVTVPYGIVKADHKAGGTGCHAEAGSCFTVKGDQSKGGIIFSFTSTDSVSHDYNYSYTYSVD